MLELASASDTLPPFDAAHVDELTDSELDGLPFGVIGLDESGIILRYNLYESRFARLDRNQVLGRLFFGEVAPCTKGPAFEGRFQRLVAGGEGATPERFPFLFDFRHGAQQAEVEIVRVPGAARFYVLLNRREVMPPRPDLPPGGYAVLQRELAPDEAQRGVRRDALEQRFVEVPWSVLAALRATCDRLAPESWQLFCSEWGVQWGRRTAIDLESLALEKRGRSLKELSMRDVAQLIAGHFARQGWGLAAFDFAAAREGVIAVELQRSALAESAPRRSSNGAAGGADLACHLFAGSLGGLFTHVAGRRLVAREVACAASGAPCCSFVIVAAPRRAILDAALTAGGRGVDAIRAALRRAPATPEDA